MRGVVSWLAISQYLAAVVLALSMIELRRAVLSAAGFSAAISILIVVLNGSFHPYEGTLRAQMDTLSMPEADVFAYWLVWVLAERLLFVVCLAWVVYRLKRIFTRQRPPEGPQVT